ncbi:MAG: homoserine dehydrogenase [Halothiobacillaceae bacterium]|nr:homoserine dehydrogenase [Halothiobacillaceae bacterium]
MSIRIAIVGLGRVGSSFLEALLAHPSAGVTVLAVAETGETPGVARAREVGIPVRRLEDIVALCEEVDVIFDLTGQADARRALREGMAETGNVHTVIAPEVMARLTWSLLEGGELPDVHEKTGY